MKYLKLIIFAFTLFICNIANADTLYVNTPVLNLRSCPSTKCEIVGKLMSGKSIYVEEYQGDWVKVQTDIGNGYVVKRLLVDNLPHSSDETNLFASLIILILVLSIAWFFYMLPARLARHNKNAGRMYKVNLFLGWVPGVWIILLIVALVSEKVDQ